MSDEPRMNKDYDYIFKIVLIGDTSVGKSCVLTRFADDQFTDSYVTTIGVDFRFKTMIVNEKIVKVQVWDTAGEERYRSITNAYYRGAEAIMIIFDITNKESFINIQNWMNEVVKFTGDDVLIVVGANKSDLEFKNVSNIDMQEFTKNNDIQIFEMSAKTGKGVENAFKYMVEELIKRKNNAKNGKNSKLKLISQGQNGKGMCCWG